MTGCLVTTRNGDTRHDHVEIDLSDGTTLVYSDPRRFGLMSVVTEPPPQLTLLGVDPLSTDFSADYLRRTCSGRKRPIKNVLMDQRLIAGLGNIYASEILYRAGVRPSRPAGRVTARERAAICGATVSVLEDAIRLGGSSISDYRDGEGREGSFQMHFDVYGRAGDLCRRCATRVRARVLSGRSSFYCPQCQR
jgi:formamidopyrimidine-DNA glycosylase